MKNPTKIKLMIIAHPNRQSGGRSVGHNLLEHLLDQTERFDMLATLPVGCGYEDLIRKRDFEAVWFDQGTNPFKRFFFDTFALPRIALRFKPDVMLCLGHMGYPRIPVKQLVRFADPHFVYSKSHYGSLSVKQKLRYMLQRIQFRKTVRIASILYCQTQTMKDRLLQQYPVSGQVHILPNSMPKESAKPTTQNQPPLLRPYSDAFRLFCLTRYNPHKNLELLVDTYRQYRQELQDTVVFITIAPDQHPHASKLLKRIQTDQLDKQIINIGPIRQSEIGSWFAHCHGFVLPTLLESFSASYLEAMFYRLPILTSDLDFARDVCGQAALYFDPRSARSLKDAILRLKNDSQLHKTLAEEGTWRLQTEFQTTWKDNVQQICQDIQVLGSEPNLKE